MKEPGSNVEITNPIYMRDYDEDEGGPDYGDFHSDKVNHFKTMVLFNMYKHVSCIIQKQVYNMSLSLSYLKKVGWHQPSSSLLLRMKGNPSWSRQPHAEQQLQNCILLPSQIIFYKRCLMKRRLGLAGVGQAFCWYDNDKDLRTYFFWWYGSSYIKSC